MPVTHGQPPYLECSSRGAREFSAFYARVGGRTIESIYQGAKKFPCPDAGRSEDHCHGGQTICGACETCDGRGFITGLGWREAKGRTPINALEVRALYSSLWDQYIQENPHLVPKLLAASGLSDMFGKRDHCCQATELWRIRTRLLALSQGDPQ